MQSGRNFRTSKNHSMGAEAESRGAQLTQSFSGSSFRQWTLIGQFQTGRRGGAAHRMRMRAEMELLKNQL